MDDIVPVAVPYTVSAGTTTCVPADTHLFHWCTSVSLPPQGQDPGTERQPLHPGITALDGTLHINGEPVGATSDVIRPGSGPALAFWNITDPLPEGTHEAEFQLTIPSDGPRCSPARIGVAGELSIDWEPGEKISLSRTIISAPSETVQTRCDVDPLWGRRDVHYVSGRSSDGDNDMETFVVKETAEQPDTQEIREFNGT